MLWIHHGIPYFIVLYEATILCNIPTLSGNNIQPILLSMVSALLTQQVTTKTDKEKT